MRHRWRKVPEVAATVMHRQWRRHSRAAGSASAAAVGPAGRLPCGARPRGLPHNSLRSLRSLRSDRCGKFEVEARCARWPRGLRSSAPQRRCAGHPAAPSWRRHIVRDVPGAALGRAAPCCPQGRGRAVSAATLRRRGAQWSGPARAQHAHPPPTCRICLSAESEANAASYAAGPGREHRRAVGAAGADRRSRSGGHGPAAPLLRPARTSESYGPAATATSNAR